MVPVASLLVAQTGNWHLIFLIAVAMNVLAAMLAIALLRPMRLSLIGHEWSPQRRPG
jgi:OFA family oxalate/formate antiporter-like MFS transporter